MDSQSIWQMFLETGAPEMYLLFNKVRKMEEGHVPDGSRAGTESNTLQ